MANQDFATTLFVAQTPEEVFEAIRNVRGWWSETVEGDTKDTGDEFVYQHKDLHYSKQKLVEVAPNKKIVWLVTDSRLTFTKKQSEWTGTQINFEIREKNGGTEICFTHIGLLPSCECFDACSNGWSYYLYQSLLPLIPTGKGMPDQSGNKVNAEPEIA